MPEREFSGRKEGRSFRTGEKEQRETNHDHGKPKCDPASHGQETGNRLTRGNGPATGSVRQGTILTRSARGSGTMPPRSFPYRDTFHRDPAASLLVGAGRTGRLFRCPSANPVPGGPGNVPFTESIVLQAHRLSHCIHRYHNCVNERENQEAISHGNVDKQPVFERPLECLLIIKIILGADQGAQRFCSFPFLLP